MGELTFLLADKPLSVLNSSDFLFPTQLRDFFFLFLFQEIVVSQAWVGLREMGFLVLMLMLSTYQSEVLRYSCQPRYLVLVVSMGHRELKATSESVKP